MVNDVLERFKYRFQLWRREQREDWIGPPGTHLPNLSDYANPESAHKWDDPKYKVLLTESTLKCLIRGVGVYFCIIIIAAQICRLIGVFIPIARFAMFLVFVVFFCLWTLVSVFGEISVWERRKRFRAAQPSNHATLRPTAGRCNKKVEG
jgi:hypothetical protein